MVRRPDGLNSSVSRQQMRPLPGTRAIQLSSFHEGTPFPHSTMTLPGATRASIRRAGAKAGQPCSLYACHFAGRPIMSSATSRSHSPGAGATGTYTSRHRPRRVGPCTRHRPHLTRDRVACTQESGDQPRDHARVRSPGARERIHGHAGSCAPRIRTRALARAGNGSRGRDAPARRCGTRRCC